MKTLAYAGGQKAVSFPFPHFTWPEVNEDEIRAVEQQMRTGKNGEYGYPFIVEEFEQRFRDYHGMRYALAMNSGTSCLHAAFYALGITEGDEVLVPTFTFPATATPLFLLQAIPVLCDCLKDTVTIDPMEIERKITPRTKAIAITHLWGHPCEMDEIMAIAGRYGLPVVEDCSHAHGAKYKNKLVGTFGAVACFSCDNQKMLASGEAGVLLTNSQEIFEKSLVLSDFGGRTKLQLELPQFKLFDETGLGLKYRIHPLAATIANEKLKRLDHLNNERVSMLNYFSGQLTNTVSLIPPATRSYCQRGGYYGYKCIYDNSRLNVLTIQAFIALLQAEGVDIRQTVTPPLHRLELFRNSSNYGIATNSIFRGTISELSPADFPGSEWFQANHVSFPTFSKSSDKKIIDEYITAIKKVERIVINETEIVSRLFL